MIRLTADHTHTGLSLVSFLCLHYPAPSVNKAFKLKAVRVDGLKRDREFSVEAGMSITLHCAMEKKEDLRILFEDNFLVAVEKPAGLVSQQNPDLSWEQSLEGRICRQTGQTLILVHRLDRETSGCILLAKDRSVFDELKGLFAGRSVEKIYLTLVKGLMEKDKGSWTNLLPDSTGKKVQANSDWMVLGRNIEKKMTLLQARIGTGRHHQIRRHFSMNGFPVAGDGEYGDFSFNKILKNEAGLKRQFLHAYKLTFVLRGRTYDIVSDLPDELKKILVEFGFDMESCLTDQKLFDQHIS